MRVRRFAHLYLPACKRSVGQARRALAALVPAGDVADNGKLLVSEAVANAVEHTGSDQVRVLFDHDDASGELVCAVRDSSTHAPVATGAADMDSENGAACTSSTHSRTPGATSPTATANGSGSVSPPQREPDGLSYHGRFGALPGRHQGRHREDSAAHRLGRGVPL